MRPSLEDLLELLIREFGIDAQAGHQDALENGREAWRRRQIATLVRDAAEEAVRVLQENGCAVSPPVSGALATRLDTLRRW